MPGFSQAGLLAAIVQSSDDAIVSKDLHGVVTSWNAAAERMFGYTAAEMVGRSILTIIPAERRQEEDFVLSRIRQGLVVDHFETVRQRKDGSQFEISLTVSPVRDEHGVVVGASKIARDISEQRKLREAYEEASRTKDEFIAMLGHELRNPLAPILTALHLMELRHVGGDRERALIKRQVQHVVSLVDDLLDISRVTRGVLKLQKQRVNLAEVVATAIEMTSPLLEARRHHLSVTLPPTDPLAIDADPARMAQILSNLLTNAAKYTDEGGRIAIEGVGVGDQVVLRVRDTGVGIAPAAIARIFDMFAQERLEGGARPHGLGIGLAIVKNLVQLHGGSVSASSAGPGAGSTFEVRLPRAPVGAVRAAAPTAESGDVRAPELRVLIVDDNHDAAAVLADSLSFYGHTTRVAHDGPSALAAAQAFVPDFALLDIGLPGMDGYELATELRQLPMLRDTRLVALTGYGQQSDRDRSRAHGFEEHLVKPTDPEDVHRLIVRLAGRQTEPAPREPADTSRC